MPLIAEPLCAVFRRALKAEGLKYTPERAAVLDAIVRFESVFEPDRVVAAVRNSGMRVSKATVYRTLKLLQDAGVIQRVLFDEEQSFYQLVYADAPGDVLVRLDSKEAVPIRVPELKPLLEKVCAAAGLRLKGHRLHIFAEP